MFKTMWSKGGENEELRQQVTIKGDNNIDNGVGTHSGKNGGLDR
jgi:hypothetical protein